MHRFFQPGNVADRIYEACRDQSSKRPVRARIECMWRAYRAFCPDKHFLVDAQSHFVSRTWELYLAATMLDKGCKLLKPPPKGPDILVETSSGLMWIEAVAVGAGVGVDAVPPRALRGEQRGATWLGRLPSEESLILRCLIGIGAKLEKILEYRSAKIVADTDQVIIAVSVAGIEDADIERPGCPLIARALFGISPPHLSLPIDAPGQPTTEYFEQREVMKRAGTTVEMKLFCSTASAPISAVMFSSVGIWNAPAVLGNDIVVVHNPLASARIEPGYLGFSKEYTMDDTLRIRQHRSST